MHYVDRINRIDFGEVDFDVSTRKKVMFKEVCGVQFYDIFETDISFNRFKTLKNEAIFTVLENFIWSGEYEETPEDLIECLEDLGIGPLDLNTLKTDEDVKLRIKWV